ncbi:MAG: L-serine ammonia-lyase [Paracoccus denitrificans]|uniref:L-serine dehydratase n=1 Tax=Paracoccus denitrificans TaxID=266 RepID=A0A533I7P1_PARDE|nr:MAG: L-serine ammonia-lyase [Paracoccus denitrificans]
MFLSVLELFKIGVGPSSSHTMGPMIAANRFAQSHLADLPEGASVEVILWGSLAFTGKGHATDRAVILGLAGIAPETLLADEASRIMASVQDKHLLPLSSGEMLDFDPEKAIRFAFGERLDAHSNALTFRLLDADGAALAEEVFYSIGGGFVLTGEELERMGDTLSERREKVPFPFGSAAEMLDMAAQSGLSISEMKRQNEIACRPETELTAGLTAVVSTMFDCIKRGLATQQATLPGGLDLERRAPQLAEDMPGRNLMPHSAFEKVAAYAIAVNEENAAGGRIVTAPTNGAAGIVPAVMRYAHETLDLTEGDPALHRYLLTAAAIGGLIKANASISGAECGCQAEVGSASAMAAAGLAELLGGTPAQVENAAEIALEHHLGMTCDPVLGLVQVPCIERNALGSVKAITAAALALRGTGKHFMPLDACIETMRQTGEDMLEKYKETSLGGLAVNSPNC